MILKIEGFLKLYSNIISFAASITSIIALIISIIAYLESKKKSKIILKYNVKDSDEYKNNKYFKNKKGVIELKSKYYVNENEESKVGVESDLNLVIENTSDIVAKNPIINFRFINLNVRSLNLIEELTFDKIECKRRYNWSKLESFRDNYSEFRWEPKDGTVIHKGIKIIETFKFDEIHVFDSNTYVEVILSADNMKTKKFKIPIEIIYM